MMGVNKMKSVVDHVRQKTDIKVKIV